jgi:hypothetical protein
MTQDSWPSVESEAQPPSPLPRVEDLPMSSPGYEPERVREAFDAFYRHLARLDATLRTIEAVEVFRDQAGELRKELRALRSAGWTQQPWLPSYPPHERVRVGLPEAVARWALEAAFVVAVPVVAFVADQSRLVIALSAVGAWLLVALVEWVSSRERPAIPAPAVTTTAAVPVEEEPAPAPAPEPTPALPVGEATEWTLPPAQEEPEPEPEPEALTVVAEPEPVPEPEPEAAEEPEATEEPEPEPRRRFWQRKPAQAAEPVEEPEPVEPQPQPIVLPAEPARGRWWRRRPSEEGEEADVSEAERPKHVRILSAGDAGAGVEHPPDPWEEELDLTDEGEPEPSAAEPEPTRPQS